MASFASSATTGGARKHAWTNTATLTIYYIYFHIPWDPSYNWKDIFLLYGVE